MDSLAGSAAFQTAWIDLSLHRQDAGAPRPVLPNTSEASPLLSPRGESRGVCRPICHAPISTTGSPRICSTVSNGWVTLEGEVASWSERDAAEKAIRNLGSVRGVANMIEITATKVISSEIRHAIKLALERQAERESQGVDLQVEDGCVNLSGVVHSWAERETVIAAARGTSGVRKVNYENLCIDSYASDNGQGGPGLHTAVA